MEDDEQHNPHISPPNEPEPLNDHDDEDSFYARQADAEEEEKKSSDDGHHKHKESKQKKKHILKKKEKPSKSIKKPHMSREKEKENRLYQLADQRADQVIARMKQCYDTDILLFEQKKLACRKLSYLEELGKQLRNLYLCEKFLQKDGLNVFERWLDKIVVRETAVEPSVSLRKGILEILLSMNVGADNVSKTNEIQRLVARQKRSQVKELRDLSEKIINKWNQLAYDAGQ